MGTGDDLVHWAGNSSSSGGGGGAKFSRGLCSHVSTHRAGRDAALERGFPTREQGPLVLLSSLGEPVGATVL